MTVRPSQLEVDQVEPMRGSHSVRRLPDFIKSDRHRWSDRHRSRCLPGSHNSRIPLIFKGFRATFAANKKWAFGPLISPPAGAHTEKTGGQTRCTLRIQRNLRKFNYLRRGGPPLSEPPGRLSG